MTAFLLGVYLCGLGFTLYAHSAVVAKDKITPTEYSVNCIFWPIVLILIPIVKKIRRKS